MIIQENGDRTRHEARNNTENTQKLQAAEGKFGDALWPCNRSLMCYQYNAIVCVTFNYMYVWYSTLFCSAMEKAEILYADNCSISS